MEPPATQTTLMEAPAIQTTSDITALCRRHGRHRHPRRNYILHVRVPAEAYAQALLKWEGDSSDRQQLMKQILVATHSNRLNAGGRAWRRSSRQSGAIRPHHSPGAGVDGGRRGERLNSGQISPYQLKWWISSYRHALGALTPVSDTLRSHAECRAAQ